jgi:lipopolysaccharide export system protein LptA
MMHKKLILLFIFFGLWVTLNLLHAQQVKTEAPKTTTTISADTTRVVEIIRSNKLQLKKPNDTTDLTILTGDVRLKQGNSLFYCDSCVINNTRKTLEAFGKVHINDSDTTDIYSDYLRYLSETKKAYFNGNVKLTDGHGTLTTPDMDYDMNTKVGTYTKGGKVVNKKSVLTSQEGYYYADLKDVYFKKNVVLKDPAYSLTADSLLYSTAFETVRFITKTIIIDSNKRKITTSDGYYDLKKGKAEFGKRPFVEDGKTTIVGNKIAFDDSTGISQAEGNAIIVDSANGTTIIADEIFRNRKTEAILATKKPIMIIKQEGDSIYVTADTLFSARLTDLYSRPASFRKDSVVQKDSAGLSKMMNIKPDSVLIRDSANNKSIAIVNDSLQKINLPVIRDTTANKIAVSGKDSLLVTDTVLNKHLAIKPDSVRIRDSAINKGIAIVKDSLQKVNPPVTRDTTANKIAVSRKDSLLVTDTVLNKHLAIKPDTVNNVAQVKKDSITNKAPMPVADTLAKKAVLSKKEKRAKNKLAVPTETAQDTTVDKTSLTGVNTLDLKENDSTNRYFEAFRHVRIYSDSMQAVCDSMFYSFHDSTFRLFDDPVIWSKESQITGDTIHMITKNKKADRLKVWNNSLLVNKLEKEAFNQIKSSRMDAYFLNGDIDSVRARGSAECIYYLQDKDSAYTGINQSQSDIMDVYFREKEINRVVFRSSVKGTLWPIRQKNPAEMRLQNFKWLEARRPKTKYELFE